MAFPETTSTSSEQYPILEMRGITKEFPQVLACNNIDLTINNGEILALLGENGAGKSTLMKILSGLYQAEAGEIHADRDWFLGNTAEGRVRSLIQTKVGNPREAIKIGIGMVHQHFQLVEPFTVTENIILGREFTKGRLPILDTELAETEIREFSRRYGLPIDPTAIIEDLPIGLRQRVEILKQLYRRAQLLIFDEPTAVLTPTEVGQLFKTMRKLKESGKSIIFISHKLKETLEIADRIVVLRKGEVVGQTFPNKVNERQLAEMLVGRKLVQSLERQETGHGKPVLSVNNLVIRDLNKREVVRQVSFQVHEGEILGVAGVQGNGQTELTEALVGLRKDIDGSILLYPYGKEPAVDLTTKSTLNILKEPIAYIPEDRQVQGLITDFKIDENSWLGFYHSSGKAMDYVEDPQETPEGHSHKGGLAQIYLLPKSLMNQLAEKIINVFDVKAHGPEVLVGNLSGGNQQKVLLGRELAKRPSLIIASQPTRGVDIGAAERVHQELMRMRNTGSGILLVSADLDEVLKLSDRIIIFYEGEIVGAGPLKEMPLSKISELMTSGKETGELGEGSLEERLVGEMTT